MKRPLPNLRGARAHGREKSKGTQFEREKGFGREKMEESYCLAMQGLMYSVKCADRKNNQIEKKSRKNNQREKKSRNNLLSELLCNNLENLFVSSLSPFDTPFKVS